MCNKIALVTGGLSGIGKGTVLELSKKGYNVVIFDIQDDKADKIIEECKEYAGEVIYKHCDLFNSADIRKGFKFIKEKYGRLDCAFNNAGFGIYQNLLAKLQKRKLIWNLEFLLKHI